MQGLKQNSITTEGICGFTFSCKLASGFPFSFRPWEHLPIFFTSVYNINVHVHVFAIDTFCSSNLTAINIVYVLYGLLTKCQAR